MQFKSEVAAIILRQTLTANTSFGQIENITQEEFFFHAALLSDIGLIHAFIDPGARIAEVQRITWDGYSRLSCFDESLGREFDPKMFVRNFQRP